LPTDSLFIAICRSRLALQAVEMELSGIIRHVPGFISKHFFFLCQFQGKLTGTLTGFRRSGTCEAS
jgi:hypothetical protein